MSISGVQVQLYKYNNYVRWTFDFRDRQEQTAIHKVIYNIYVIDIYVSTLSKSSLYTKMQKGLDWQITSSNRFRKRSPWSTKSAENTSDTTNAKRNCHRFTLLTRSWMSFGLAALLPVLFIFILRLFLLLLDKQKVNPYSPLHQLWYNTNFIHIISCTKLYPHNFMYTNIKLRLILFLSSKILCFFLF